MNIDKEVDENLSSTYNPWGQKDSRTKWITNRGYTGHEHLDAFGIINMNGRVYDPQTAMFFSPDPFVQAPDNWVNYNRYGYCLNNPLIYTDPTGFKNWQSAGYWTPSAEVSQMWDYLSGLREGAWTAGQNVCGGGAGGAPMDYYSVNGNFYNEHGDQVTRDEYIDGNTIYHASGINGALYLTNYGYRPYPDPTVSEIMGKVAISTQDAINALPNGLSIMVSLSQEFTKANPGEFAITTVNGTQVMMSTDQLIGALELASKFTLIAGIGIEGGIAVLGSGIAQQDAKQNFWSDTMVSISLYTISVAGCGVPALILTVGWIMYRNHAFDGILKQQYYQNNYTPNTITPQDAIPQYPLKDGPQPIYFNH